MRKTIETVKYQILLYFRSPKFVMPLALLLTFLCVLYAVAPVGVIDSFTVTAAGLFFIMVWIGLSCQTLESPVSEQLMVLKLGSPVRYAVCRCLFLVLLGWIVSAAALLYPIAAHAVNRFALFSRTLTLPDAAGAFTLFCCATCMGAAVGSLFHPRILRDRKIALLLTAFIAIAGLAKAGIVRQIPAAGIIAWLLPPLADVISLFTGAEQFSLSSVVLAAALMVGYGILLFALNVFLLYKKKF